MASPAGIYIHIPFCRHKCNYCDFFSKPIDEEYVRKAYTRALLRACPRTDITVRRLEAIPGTVPPLTEAMPGCTFAPRCREAAAECSKSVPPLIRLEEGPGFCADGKDEHLCACHKNVLGRAS